MQVKYNQLTAMLAITRASLKAIVRSPSAVVFALAFPLIFILVFGFIGGSNKFSLNIVVDPASDTANPVYQALKQVPALKLQNISGSKLTQDLEKGRVAAVVSINKRTGTSSPFLINIRSSEAVNPQNLQVLRSIINDIIARINNNTFPDRPTIATVNENITKIAGRTFRTIDFILPGQLGFSLLSSGVFGVAFLFFNLRQQLVLKRFYATPIQRPYIILGEALSRVIFQMITAVIIIGIGHYAFNYTLVNGLTTFVEILFLSFFSVIIFMGFGFVVSGIASNESTIPPIANIFTLPQFLLAGTFFPIDVFPQWLQPLCRMLPLTHFNDAMRKIAFEGAHLTDCGWELTVLLIWGIVVYAVAVKVFKWE